MPVTTLEKNSEKQSSIVMNPELEQRDLVSIDTNQLQPFCFSYRFTDAMLMGADIRTVETYLDAHQGWFTRCAHPMTASQLGKNGYALTIGKFNSFGYAVEPKIGLELLPQDSGVYRIKTLAIPDYNPPGYEVSFNAQMRLIEVVSDERSSTKIDWDLDLKVLIQFPKFIYKLPTGVIQGTGDKLLKQIVNRVSRQLTHKVQQDFHGSFGLQIPKK
ncbi:DUF1997 domain-containing protein [Chamaesiphon minutus]|uniref:DUF1997 domain-containing protein n=1 Tax=Chamaesiphon minutus (strain ATCC 27169 / PCC 6605) TaxID=1173020 RepID=K9UQ00_CHAP6|nr:DUF1997 domain-containing protein [Chamaesiphon minutus]AFY96269.1 Protein of unknown function (DUF1997) [Chamaesiphon minutus PCC 6605]